MLKQSTRRRRSKLEVKEAKRREAQEQSAIADKMLEIQQLQQQMNQMQMMGRMSTIYAYPHLSESLL